MATGNKTTAHTLSGNDAAQGAAGTVGPDPEILLTLGLLCAAVVVGLATVGDYGITVDEYNADDYGPKALAWYTSGFRDRSSFESVEETLWYYGPWFHMLTAFVQSLNLASHWTVRHALTFLIGLAGIATLLPMARLAFGRWAGLTAVGLCLITGYLYGSIFFTPIDVPFLFAMTSATLAIVVMATRTVPSWPATFGAGALTGLAIATRSSGLIVQVYLVGAMVLCGLEALLQHGRAARGPLMRIGLRTLCALLFGWVIAFALWPWLQIGNPFAQFKEAFVYFANHPASWELSHWGATVTTNDLPWSYVPLQLAARLPEGFLLLLIVGLLSGAAAGFGLLRTVWRARAQRDGSRLRAAALAAAHSRQALTVWAGAIAPIAFVIVQRSTLYDGIRHVLFIIPMLALIAGYGFVRLLPVLRRFRTAAAVGGGAYAGYALWTLAALHPLEYVSFNVFAGGVRGAYERFEMDYWAVAATVALRRLEHRLDYAAPSRFAEAPASLMICIGYREGMVAPMFERPWRVETDPEKADFIIETERWRCAEKTPAVLIDEVKRFGRTFAWVYANQPLPIAGPAVPDGR